MPADDEMNAGAGRYFQSVRGLAMTRLVSKWKEMEQSLPHLDAAVAVAAGRRKIAQLSDLLQTSIQLYGCQES